MTARYAGADEPALSGLTSAWSPARGSRSSGPSGAGKTTVTNLLLRFLDPEEGRVTLAGRDLREYRQEDVRAMFALAGQDSHVFNSTIRANLQIGRPGATDEELWDALRRAQLARLGLVAARRARDAGRRGRDAALGRPASAADARARTTVGCARAPARRADRAPRSRTPRTRSSAMFFAAADGRSVLLISHRPEGSGARRPRSWSSSPAAREAAGAGRPRGRATRCRARSTRSARLEAGSAC